MMTSRGGGVKGDGRRECVDDEEGVPSVNAAGERARSE